MTRRAVFICPGRGTYNKPELGYLHRHHSHQMSLISEFDAMRSASGLPTLSALDGAASFDPALFSSGSNASGLIFSCGYLDAQVVSDDIEVVAVTGNSMGWYTALSVAGALTPQNGFRVADTMGQLMQKHLIGGQLVYPFVDDDWVMDNDRKSGLLDLMHRIGQRSGHELSLSIDLGGMLVMAGNEAGLAAFSAAVPARGVFPLRLQNHAAFHSHLQAPVAAEGAAILRDISWDRWDVPMVDGAGKIWWPQEGDRDALRDYTLGDQVTRTYDFTCAIQTVAREFAPDVFIVAGPGTTLGGAVAQSLVAAKWHGMTCRQDFLEVQNTKGGLLMAMGRSDQRDFVSDGP